MTHSILRLATTEDAAGVAEIYAPIVIDTPTSFELEPPSAAEMAARIAQSLERHAWLVCVAGDQVLGYAYGGSHRARPAYQWTAEVSVYVRPAAQRGGVGRGLYASLLRLLTIQGYQAAVAGIMMPNPASVGFHESFGFVPVGIYPRMGYKQGAWHDVGWWSRPLGSYEVEPAPPRPLTALAVDELAAALAEGQRALRPAIG